MASKPNLEGEFFLPGDPRKRQHRCTSASRTVPGVARPGRVTVSGSRGFAPVVPRGENKAVPFLRNDEQNRPDRVPTDSAAVVPARRDRDVGIAAQR